MKPDENLLSDSELTDFLASLKLKNDENLLSAIVLVNDPATIEILKKYRLIP